MSLDGESWLYVNPLQVRDGYVDAGGDQSSRRTRWFRCACCPPNVMRLLGSLEHYLATTDGRGLQLHQYASGRFEGEAQSRPVVVSVNTDYPWQGRIEITVEQTPARPWTLSLRIPQWCTQYTLVHGESGEAIDGAVLDDGWLCVERAWSPGERVVLELDLRPRLVVADPRVDAVRGCVAIERGPLVHCLEQEDHPGGGLDDVTIDPDAPLAVKERPDLLGGIVTVLAGGHRRALPETGWWPYAPAGASGGFNHPTGSTDPQSPGPAMELTAIPYYAWANRSTGSMRVWLPTG
jgi:DUF1680 family protein